MNDTNQFSRFLSAFDEDIQQQFDSFLSHIYPFIQWISLIG
jgi:hypothetical protein